MIETLELEEPVQLHDAPKLLIEWSSRWEEFVTSIRPALARSSARLAGEAPYGMWPYRGMLTSWVIEAFLLFVVIVLPMKIAQLRPYVAPKFSSHDVIYYSGDELPRTEDLGGAQAGSKGRAGGSEAHHRTQTIKIARGGSLRETVVDAPNLKLPASKDAVANLLAIKPNPGPPPLEGMRSSRREPGLTANIVAPAPNVIRDYTRGGQTFEAVVPPAPNLSRDHPLTTPTLNAAVIPPAPSVSRERTLVAPALGAPIVAPAPSVSRDKARVAPALAGSVIPPAPGVPSRDISRSAVQMTNPAVVPPPVSSPERQASRNAGLTMPAPAVIAPPPASEISPDLHRLASGSVPDPAKSVVPPPPTAAGNTSFMSSILGKIFGTTDVVAPPPTVTGGATPGGTGPSLSANVVPPPPGIAGGNTLGNPNGVRRGTEIATNVVPPPPSAVGSGSGRNHSATESARGSLTSTNVVPPPPAVTSTGRGGNGSGRDASIAQNVVPPPPAVSATGRGGSDSGRDGAPGGTLLAENVVPPPPSLGGGTARSGFGSGIKGSGFGEPLSAGSVLAPPSSGGSGGSAALVVSKQPGSKVGVPSSGASIGHGNGSGSGMTGEGSGAGKSGLGRGSDANARGGISPTAGPGGAGNATSGTPAVPGVSITGGSTIVTLPSFGSDGGSSAPNPANRSSVKEQQGPAITIVATSRSGGAFNFYGKLPGDNYTIYVPTAAGTMVMQFADPASASQHFSGTLTGPQALRADLPTGLPQARVVIACILDTSGNLKNLHVLEPGPAEVTAKVLAALPSWKFRPATRGNQPVEVNAILGFGIDTNDRY
jgi:Gram-negative bacterial TonB protein C-terminal